MGNDSTSQESPKRVSELENSLACLTTTIQGLRESLSVLSNKNAPVLRPSNVDVADGGPEFKEGTPPGSAVAQEVYKHNSELSKLINVVLDLRDRADL